MPKPKYIPLKQFPHAFQAELARLAAERQDVDLFSKHSWRRSISHASANLLIRRLHRGADALVRGGVPIQKIDSLSFVTRPSSVRTMLQVCDKDHGNLPSIDNWYLASALIRVGKNWVGQGRAVQEKLKGLQMTILANPTGTMGRTYAGLLEQFDNDDALFRLVNAPRRLFRQVQAEERRTGHTLTRAQGALAMDIMINVAPTFAPFSQFSFEKHFELTGSNKWGLLVLDGTETPSGDSLKCDLPPAVVRRLLGYRDVIYPGISGRPSKYLFARKDGGLKSKPQVCLLLQKAALRYADVRVTPQLFRALAGMLMIRAGKSVEEVAQALGCKSTETLETQFEDILRSRCRRICQHSLNHTCYLC
jgi:hypothetical protein